MKTIKSILSSISKRMQHKLGLAFALIMTLGVMMLVPSTLPAAHVQAQTLSLSSIKHVFIIVMENHDWSAITPSAAPYIWNTLIPSGSYATNYHNVLPTSISLHPSEPNYVYLEGGTTSFSDFTFTTDNDASSTNSTASTAHLATLLNNKGLSWKAYQEGMPAGTCPITAGGTKYAAKHDPFVFFQDVSGNPPSSTNSYCASHHSVLTTTQLQNDLNTGNVANYNFLTPNLCNDMHDCSVTTGDTWLSTMVPIILNSSLFKQDGLLLITWDEGCVSGCSGSNNPIGMIVESPFAKKNYVSTLPNSHASTIKTIENIFGLSPYIGHANDAGITDLSDFFTFSSSTTPTGVIVTATPTPIPPTPTRTPSPTPKPTNTPTSTPAPTSATSPTATTIPSPTSVGCTTSLPATGATVTLSTTLSTAATYRVWTRLEPQDTVNNSFYLQVDTQCPVVVGDGSSIPANSWSWVDYQNGTTTNPIDVSLTSGTHVFKIVERESGLRLDKMLLTDDTSCIPTSTGDNCTVTVTSTPTLTPVPTSAPSDTPTPTIVIVTVTPTSTPVPTATPIPTATPKPTATPTAIPTAFPTPTPTTNFSNGTLIPTADTYVAKGKASINYGTKTEIISDGSPVDIAYIKFDLTPLTGLSFHTAKLRFYVTNQSNETFSIYDTATTWNETSVNYNTRPTQGQFVTSFTNNVRYTWKEIDVTSYITSHVGHVVSLGISTSGTDGVFFSSKEGTNKPQLLIQ